MPLEMGLVTSFFRQNRFMPMSPKKQIENKLYQDKKMSIFWIFVICLTVVYIIYYTVVICSDLYRKPKDKPSSSVETFDVPDQPEESSKAVEETDGGFRVSRGGGDPSWDETDLRTAPAAVPEQLEDQPAHKLDASGAPVSELDEKIEKAAESMEQIRPEMTGELMSLTMETALKEGRPPLPIEKKVTPAPEGAKEKKEKKDENADAE